MTDTDKFQGTNSAHSDIPPANSVDVMLRLIVETER